MTRHPIPRTGEIGQSSRKGNIMATMLTAKEIAQKLETTPRTLRKFLRSDEKVESPGKGGRYSIQANQVTALKRRFDAWVAAKAVEVPESDSTLDEGDSSESA